MKIKARQSFHFFKQNKIPVFLKTIELCLNICTGLCSTLISIIKL